MVMERMQAAQQPDYATLAAQLQAFGEEEPWFAALLSNASALIYETLPDLNWAGFYLERGGKGGRGAGYRQPEEEPLYRKGSGRAGKCREGD